MSRNKITWTELQLREAINKCSSLNEVEHYLGLSGNNYVTIRKKAAEWGVDLGKFEKIRRPRYAKLSMEEIFCVDSKASQAVVRHNVLKFKLINYKCSGCSLLEVRDSMAYWNQIPISLQLDHINGINNDHRIENLRWLCPNCHSQTTTYGGKNASKNLNQARTETIAAQIEAKQQIKLKLCIFCHNPFPITRDDDTYCSQKCVQELKLKNSKKIKISKEDLARLVWEKPVYKLCKEFGVSDKSVAKWCKQYGIEIPSRGYWQKKYAGKLDGM